MTRHFPAFLIGLVLVLTFVETVFWISDAGVLGEGSRNLRAEAIAYAAFWPGLLRDWQPNFRLQPVTMFASYAFLHAGPVHLAMNMLTLLSLGRAVIARSGARRFIFLYTVSVLGGAAGYGLLAPGFQPMVGASGGLFGLAGALVGWEYADRRHLRMDALPVLKAILLLVGVNLAMYWALDGRLAWQAHLGGSLAGAAGAWILDRFRPPEAGTI